jgi:LacI family transcriptional regulator
MTIRLMIFLPLLLSAVSGAGPATLAVRLPDLMLISAAALNQRKLISLTPQRVNADNTAELWTCGGMKGRKSAETREDTAGARPRPPTMMNVAAAAGVSQATVSLVLNDIREARLSASTRARVYEAARELGYTLPGHAPSRAGRAGAATIAFLSDEISTDPWCALQLDAVREKAWEHGLTVTAGVSRGDPELEAALLDRLLQEPVVGLFYASILTRHIRPLPHLRHVPTVLLNCYVQDHSLASVLPGEVLGGYVATLHLIRAGHRRIAHVHGQSWTDPARDRIRGYRRALAEHDILYDPALVLPGNWEPPTGYEHTMTLIDLPEPPTAIFLSNDMMAVGAYDALKERGLGIPEDVSVVGYDDREIAQFMRPPLTTVVLPHFEMGIQAAELLIDGQLRPEGRQPQVKVDCPLVERASVAPPRRRR